MGTYMKPGKICCKSCGMSWPRSQGSLSDFEQSALESIPCPSCGSMTMSYEKSGSDKISGLSMAALMGCFQMQPAR